MLTAGTRAPTQIDWLLWVHARVWGSEAVEAAGLWTGPYARSFTISGQARDYQGGGGILRVERLTYGSGVNSIMAQTLKLNGISPEVESLLRGYDTRLVVAELHRLRRPAGVTSGGTIERAFKGRVDALGFDRTASDTAEGGVAITCTINMMSASRNGTRVLHLSKSDASQRAVDSADAGRKYSSATAKVAWMGEVLDPYRIGQRGGARIDADDL